MISEVMRGFSDIPISAVNLNSVISGNFGYDASRPSENAMNRSIQEELSSFIRIWKVLFPMIAIVTLTMALFSWPERWLSWFMFFLAILFGIMAYRHTRMARMALKLVEHIEPESCMVEIRKESGSDRDYFKGIVYRGSQDPWHVSFTPPLWNVDSVLQKALQAKVYFEPETEYPLVVVVDDGHLWAESIPRRIHPRSTTD